MTEKSADTASDALWDELELIELFNEKGAPISEEALRAIDRRFDEAVAEGRVDAESVGQFKIWARAFYADQAMGMPRSLESSAVLMLFTADPDLDMKRRYFAEIAAIDPAADKQGEGIVNTLAAWASMEALPQDWLTQLGPKLMEAVDARLIERERNRLAKESEEIAEMFSGFDKLLRRAGPRRATRPQGPPKPVS